MLWLPRILLILFALFLTDAPATEPA